MGGLLKLTHKLSDGGSFAEMLHRMMGKMTVMSAEPETLRLTWKGDAKGEKGFTCYFKAVSTDEKNSEIKKKKQV